MSASAPARGLAPLDVSGRATRLRSQLANAGVDALLVTHLPNVRYVTGFTGSAGFVLVTPDDLALFTDGRYCTQAGEQVAAAGVPATVEIGATVGHQRQLLAARLASPTRLGLEAHAVTWAAQRDLAEALPGCDLVPTTGIVEDLRAAKDAGEVARIGAACAIADDALGSVVALLGNGTTERAFALALDRAMRERGADGNSFETIVASGPNAAMPHARPTNRPIERREMVVIDFGCVVDGYCSDMTRTVSVGDPGPDARRMFAVVRESQQRGRDAVRAGAACADVDAACRRVIEDAGWGEAFVHSTGHGVGLEIHEAPRVAATARDTLAPGFVVTVEPGVYLPGQGGVRIEDTVVVTATGADPLTSFPKELVL